MVTSFSEKIAAGSKKLKILAAVDVESQELGIYIYKFKINRLNR